MMELREALTQIAEIRTRMAETERFRGYRAAPIALSGLIASTRNSSTWTNGIGADQRVSGEFQADSRLTVHWTIISVALTGSATVNVLPFPMVDSTRTDPPCNSA